MTPRQRQRQGQGQWQKIRARVQTRLVGRLKGIGRQLTYGLNLHIGPYHLYWDPVRAKDLRWVYITNDRDEALYRQLMTLSEVHRIARRGAVSVKGVNLVVTGVAAVVADPDDPVQSEGLPMAVIRVADPPKPPERWDWQAGTYASWDDFATSIGADHD